MFSNNTLNNCNIDVYNASDAEDYLPNLYSGYSQNIVISNNTIKTEKGAATAPIYLISCNKPLVSGNNLVSQSTSALSNNRAGVHCVRCAQVSISNNKITNAWSVVEIIGFSNGVLFTSDASNLISGEKYIQRIFVAGDDFTSSGASANASGTVFTYNGTPPTWTNGSTIEKIEYLEDCAGGGILYNNEIILADPNIAALDTINTTYQDNIYPRRNAPIVADGNVTVNNFGLKTNSEIRIALSGFKPVVTGSAAIVSDGLSTELTTGTTTGSTALLRLRNDMAWDKTIPLLNPQRGLFIGRDWSIDMTGFILGYLPDNVLCISRIIFGKVYTSETLGIPAGIKTFGFEFLGRVLRGFYSTGTNIYYTEPFTKINLSSSHDFNTSLSIKSTGGNSPSLHFFMGGSNSRNPETRSLWSLQSGLITGMNNGVHVEVDNTSSIANTRLILSDMTYKNMTFA